MVFFTQIYAEKSRKLVRWGGFFGVHNGGLVLSDGFFASLRLCAPKTSLIE
jgi:hypothetical protein